MESSTFDAAEVDVLLDHAANWAPPLDDPEELIYWYYPSVLGIQLPDWQICPHHTTPAEFVRRSMARTSEGRYVHPAILQISCRSGGKSFELALIEWTRLRQDELKGWSGRILGGSGDQAKCCYAHTEAFWDACNSALRKYVKGEPRAERTLARHGNTLGILKASQTSVRGPHPNDLGLDELDEIPEDIYQASMSQPKRRGAIDRQWLMTSTINRAGGLVERTMEDAEAAGILVLQFCWKEVARTCTLDTPCEQCTLWDACRGDLKCEWSCVVVEVDGSEVWVSRDGGRKVRVWAEDVADFSPLLEPGDRCTVIGNPHGHIDIDEIIAIRGKLSDETWDSEWCCNLKQPTGAVLRRADVDAARAPIKWELGMETWIGIDWGYANETCVVVVQWDGHGDLRVVAEAHWTQKTGAELGDVIDHIGETYHTHEAYADASDPDKIKELRKRGWTVHPVPFNPWKDRCLEALRVWLQGREGRRIRINDGLSHLLQALIQWRYKDIVVDETAERAIVKVDDHPCDATLAAMRRFAKKKPVRAARGRSRKSVFAPAGMVT